MSLLSAQLPIESHIAALLVDHLNAKAFSGGVRTVDEALCGSRRRAASSARFSRRVSRCEEAETAADPTLDDRRTGTIAPTSVPCSFSRICSTWTRMLQTRFLG